MKDLGTKDRRSNARATHKGLRAELKMIGCPHVYHFSSEDISESGLLLQHIGDDIIRFNHSSIIEVTLFIGEESPLHFFTRYVRFIPETQLLAVRITDCERDSNDRYKRFLKDESLASLQVVNG